MLFRSKTDQNFAQIYRAKKLRPSSAEDLTTGFPRDDLAFQLARVHAFEKAGDEMLTNYLSVIRLTEKLVDLLNKQDEAAIVNVTSIVALAARGFDRITARLERIYKESGSGVTIRNVSAEPVGVAAPAVVTNTGSKLPTPMVSTHSSPFAIMNPSSRPRGHPMAARSLTSRSTSRSP